MKNLQKFETSKYDLKLARAELRSIKEAIKNDKESQEYLYGCTYAFAEEPQQLKEWYWRSQKLKNIISFSCYKMRSITRRG